MSKLEARRAIREWFEKHERKTVISVRHVHPRAYVVARVAAKCLIVSKPWVDAEPQVAEHEMAFPTDTVHVFDETLDQGDWCMTGYVASAGCGQPVAVPFPKRVEKKR